MGGVQNIYNGGTAINVTIGSLGKQVIYRDGQAIDNIVEDHGLQDIYAGGVAIGTLVRNEGIQFVNSGGLAINTTVDIDGRQSIADGGRAENTQIYDAGIQVIYSGGVADSTQIHEGGVQEVFSGGRAVNAQVHERGLQIVRSGGRVEQTSVDSGGIQYVYDGGVAHDTTINGGGLSIIYTGAEATGVTHNEGILDLSRYSGNQINISGMGGKIFVYDTLTNTPRQMTLKSLEGVQTFVISADLANSMADKTVITDTTAGTHYIKVIKEATDGSDLVHISGQSAVVIQTSGGSASFEGMESSIDGVKLKPIIVQDANNWNLTGYQMVGPSNLTLTDSAGADIAYAAILSGHNSLRPRLAELRSKSNQQGVWARVYSGEYGMDGNSMNYTTIQGGWDYARKTGKGRVANGIMIEHLSANNNYALGSGKTKNTLFGIYHTWMGDSGHYYDFSIKRGRLYNELTVADEAPINGNYKTWNTTISSEYGYKHQLSKGYYLMPNIGLSYSRVNAAEYTTDSGTLVKQAAINSTLARAGINIGRKLQHAEYYLGLNFLHEFSAKTKVATGKTRTAYTLEHDWRGSSLELSLGGNINLGESSLLYVETTRGFGGKITNKWNIQAGYRLSW